MVLKNLCPCKNLWVWKSVLGKVVKRINFQNFLYHNKPNTLFVKARVNNRAACTQPSRKRSPKCNKFDRVDDKKNPLTTNQAVCQRIWAIHFWSFFLPKTKGLGEVHVTSTPNGFQERKVYHHFVPILYNFVHRVPNSAHHFLLRYRQLNLRWLVTCSPWNAVST